MGGLSTIWCCLPFLPSISYSFYHPSLSLAWLELPQDIFQGPCERCWWLPPSVIRILKAHWFLCVHFVPCYFAYKMSKFPGGVFRSFMYRILSSENKDVWLFPFLCVSFIYLVALAKTLSIPLNRGENEHPLVPGLRGDTLSFSPSSMIMALACYMLPLPCWGMSFIAPLMGTKGGAGHSRGHYPIRVLMSGRKTMVSCYIANNDWGQPLTCHEASRPTKICMQLALFALLC